MPRVFYEKEEIICIHLRGSEQDFVGFYEDGGAIHEFVRFLRNEGILGAVPGRMGPGQYVGFYRKKDMPRIEAWLKKHNFEDPPFRIPM